MRTQLKVGYLRNDQEDQEKFIELVNNSPGNLWDKDILTYPTLSILRSYDGNGRRVYLPVQQVLMLESVAVEQPPAKGNAEALRDLVKAAQLHASRFGIRELMFISRDERVLKIAEGHGFERIEWPVTRLKL